LNRKTGEPNSAENIGFHRLKQTNRANKKTNQKTKNKKTKQKENNTPTKNKNRQKIKTTEENAGFVLFLVLFLLFMVNLPVGLFFW
jgi:hypothetical protein